MRWKIMVTVVICVVVLAWMQGVRSHGRKAVEVAGNLTQEEVSEIWNVIDIRMHPPIFTTQGLRNLGMVPSRIWGRFTKVTPEVFRMERRTDGFVAVIGRWPEGKSEEKYYFWSVFREGEGWTTEDGTSISSY